MKIAPSIHRIGGNSIINAYMVEEAGAVTIIDAGVPGYYDDIPRELAAMGRSIADVRALVLTHGHSDHIGFAERLRRERNVPVSVHQTGRGARPRRSAQPGQGVWPHQARRRSWASSGTWPFTADSGRRG